MIEMALVALLVGILLAVFCLYFFYNHKEQKKIRQENALLKHRESALIKENIQGLSKLELLQNLLKEKEKTLEELKQEHKKNLAQLESKMEQNLNKQNLNFLNQNKLMLNEDLKKILEEIFTPVRQSVNEYSQRLLQNEMGLKSSIENMFQFSKILGQNADKLAQILKGDKKIRGNFAELQLKSMLENSGLVAGIQYELQPYFKEENRGYKPDAVVFLDDKKSIIIDAKFALPSSFDFEQVNEGVCRDLASNLRARIDELSKKPYAHFDTHSYDFVLLFIPYQNILDLALSVEEGLYQYAYEKKIYLTTPHTLFMALNTINISWRHIKSNDNVLKAFEELGKFHDKFVGFLEDFERLKNLCKNLNLSVENMQNKLQNGTGNLTSRVAKLKELGAKTQKNLPKGEL